jgi:hypothetical protein
VDGEDGCNANGQTTEKEDRKVVKEEVDQSRKEMTRGEAWMVDDSGKNYYGTGILVVRRIRQERNFGIV